MTQRSQTNEDLLEEAMDWFLRLQEPSRGRNDEKDFAVWIRRSPLHREAWQKACRTWQVMGATTPANEHLWRLGEKRTTLRTGSRWRGGIALALAASLIAVVVGPALLTQYSADYATATGEIRKVTLEDGSMIDLGAKSAIAVDFTSTGRHVRLLSGEAFFDVHHDAGRPFVVDAGDARVRVLGTAFDVNVTAETTTVQLARGEVGISAVKTGQSLELVPGDVATLRRDSGSLSRETIDVEAVASWRDKRLFVHDVPISAVVEELQRYHPSWIRIASSDLANRHVTGLYDLSDPDRALDALVRPYGGKVHYFSPYLRVLTLF